MSELWHDLVELLRQRPVLCVPVLVADLLGYLLSQVRAGMLRAIFLHKTMQHSALGGAVVQMPMSSAAMQSATVLAVLLSWLIYFLRLLLFSGALMVTASLVRQYLQRRRERVQETTSSPWTFDLGGAFELALRALVVYAIAALTFSTLTSVLAKHGYVAVLRSSIFGLALSLLVLLVLSAWLAPVAVRILAGKRPDSRLAGEAQQFAAILAIVVALLAAIVSANSHEAAHLTPAARYPLEIVGSLVVALPYVLLFTGLPLIARKVE